MSTRCHRLTLDIVTTESNSYIVPVTDQIKIETITSFALPASLYIEMGPLILLLVLQKNWNSYIVLVPCPKENWNSLFVLSTKWKGYIIIFISFIFKINSYIICFINIHPKVEKVTLFLSCAKKVVGF
jgi:hypothetical protein